MAYDASLNTGKVKLKDIAVSVPRSFQSSDIFEKKSIKCPNITLIESDELGIMKMISQQHPLIKTWFACSSCAICFLFLLLFVAY